MSTSGLEVKRQALLEHRENTDKEIAELDKQIEAENEPKWGDVKFYNGDCSDPVIYLDGHFYNYRHQIPANDTVARNAREMPTEFNLFTDLKALKEKVTVESFYDFASDCGDGNSVRVKLALDTDAVWMHSTNGLGIELKAKKLGELINVLRRMQAQQKRKQDE